MTEKETQNENKTYCCFTIGPTHNTRRDIARPLWRLTSRD